MDAKRRKRDNLWAIKGRGICISLIVLLMTGCSFLFFCPLSQAQMSPEDSLYTVALGAYKNGFLDLAIDQFQKFLEVYPKNQKAPFAWFRLGEAYRVQNKDSLAEAAYQKVLDLYPDHKLKHIAIFRLAGIKFKQRDFSSAILDYQRLLKEAPSSGFAQDARFWIAESLYQLRRYAEALAAYLSYINESSERKFLHQALYGSGWCQMELGRYTEAIKQFRDLLEKSPPAELIPQIHLSLGDLLFQQKDYNGALEHYEVFTNLLPEDLGKVVLKKGFALTELEKDNDAIALFQDFLKNASKGDPQIPEALFRLGRILQRQKRYPESVETLISLKKRYPTLSIIPEAIFQIGLDYLHMKENTLAKAQFEDILKHYPDHERGAEASLYMGNIHYQSGEMKEAAYFYQMAARAENATLSAEACYRMSDAFLSIGDNDKALKGFKRVISSYPDQAIWNQMARFRLANFYEQKGELELALDFYTQASQMKGGTKDLVKTAQERIDMIQKGIRESKQRDEDSSKEKMNESMP
ncbi:MAG: tetratricopeptide repeat protein [bacterium]